ncbi:hypothetical protein GBAR_LOCUS22756 [Geodia barretti]|uniref:Uncharacterized protein n=1 Tax=Geodia barretti TaxID=519541 RepID=A0AA35T4N1_GEOBA|nr:hypothetical protein GBAR_LOCUS22756 [Geodia barretti]
MSVDVAFESAEEISRKLSRYEQLFKSKYTEADAGYRRCVANAEKVRQVPVIDPWPPRGVFSRRGRYNKHDDWDGGGGRRLIQCTHS